MHFPNPNPIWDIVETNSFLLLIFEHFLSVKNYSNYKNK